MNSPPNRSLSASTNGLDQGSCCGPFGFGGTAGLAPGGGGGGLGTAAFGSAGLGGTAGLSDSAGFSVCSLSFCFSATFKYSGGTRNRKRGRNTKTWIQPHRWNRCQRPLALSSSRATEHSSAKENRITTGGKSRRMTRTCRGGENFEIGRKPIADPKSEILNWTQNARLGSPI